MQKVLRRQLVFFFLVPIFLLFQSTLSALVTSSSAQDTTVDKRQVQEKLRTLSVPFIKNEGQIDKDVAYYAKTFDATLFVTKKGEMIYGFNDFTIVERIPGLAPNLKGLTPSKTNVSSFVGNDPSRYQKSLPTFTSVSLGEITPGITVTLNAYGGKTEKIITVPPHTDPSITLSIDGASSLGLADTGELIVHTEKGDLTFSRPVAYQEIKGTKVPVFIAYKLPQRLLSYGLALGPYDPSYSLFIDPILQSTYLGR
jgi:hypothetical protein